jgi:hypothetical protein
MENPKAIENHAANAYRSGETLDDNPYEKTQTEGYEIWENAYLAEKEYWENQTTIQ